MEASELAELRTQYIFTPAAGGTWGLAFTRVKERLLVLDPNAFMRVEDPRVELPGGEAALFFEAELDGDDVEGAAQLHPEGIAVENSTATEAARFVQWLRTELVPEGRPITFNTEWGLESELPDTVVPEAPHDELVNAFLAHLIQTGDLE